ncbi:MAG: penicillin acylase family protein, partial [Candidatus Methylomirabilis sp.]|nr:penicillin acylase family protein [Deltaproteobacteria bacterium]
FERGRALIHLLEDPGRSEPGLLVHTAGPDGQSTFWDDRRTEEAESRDRIIALAMRDALADLETRLFKTADMTRWRWGTIHYATIEFPGLGSQLASFNLPSGLLLDRPAGYPRAGAIETVDVAEFGYSSFPVETGYGGPAMRMVVEDGARGHACLGGARRRRERPLSRRGPAEPRPGAVGPALRRPASALAPGRVPAAARLPRGRDGRGGVAVHAPAGGLRGPSGRPRGDRAA